MNETAAKSELKSTLNFIPEGLSEAIIVFLYSKTLPTKSISANIK
jgi:hypothetical protein